MPPRLVAIDFGTGAVRSVVFDLSGNEVASAYREITYDTPRDGPPGACEFSGRVMWGRIARAVRRSLAEARVRPGDVLAVAATSQRQGIALVDRAGRTLYAGPNRDVRGASEVDHQRDQGAFAVNGRWPMAIMAPYRLKWFQRHQPALLDRASSLLMLNDWVTYQLSGEAACAASSAAESLLLDITTLQWSPGLIEHFQPPARLFPPIVHGGDVVGRVTARAAEATGLLEGTPVAAAGGDTQCALLACGAVTPGDVAVVAGTTAPVQSVAAGPSLDPAGCAWTGVHVLKGLWVHESNAGSAGSGLRWLRDQLRAWRRGPRSDAYQRLLAPAERVTPGADGLMAFLGPPTMDRAGAYPQNRGFVFAPEAPRSFEATVTRGHFSRALLESIAYAVRANFQRLPEVTADRPARVGLCGGLGRSGLFTQVVADVLGRPVAKPKASEVAALGAGMCAAAGARAYGSVTEAASAMTQVGLAAEPDKENAQRYRTLFERWLRLGRDLSAWGWA